MQILDLLFRKRRIQKEIKVMKKQRGSEDFFRKKKVESERIAVTEKILELEKEVAAQQLK